ncbi:hypothetical protein NQ318_001435 [Aromia moschata]|uniref:Inosine/uridine-preferring nucleoside hydrolase domain-containing protein n=1 Tax=Aromia moschata TaxID=1265417 RepID=A0AAV8YY11_9CUCU|nr:hypothetical protein NQ318_001435 [Aromia moschata]
MKQKMEDLTTKRVVIDLDAGVDDYLALWILLNAEKLRKVKIEAIICSMGNTTVENVCKNVVRLLEIEGRTDIPIYRGVEKPLLLQALKDKQFHGGDGFGDLNHDSEPDVSIIRDTLAPIALCDIILNNPNEIYIICIGPLTNLAIAIKLYNNISSAIREVWIMGGNHTAVGNVTSSAEYNFYMDPEAVYIVLECLKCPIFIFPWEPCLLPKIDFEWRYNVLGDRTPALRLLTRADRKVYAELDYWIPCDAFLCFCFLDPEKHISKTSIHHVTIELHSCYTRGQVVLDHLRNKKPNVTIIENFHSELFKDLLLKSTSL